MCGAMLQDVRQRRVALRSRLLLALLLPERGYREKWLLIVALADNLPYYETLRFVIYSL